ncbi:hypothetical protein EU537_11470 [Candidatus Thorarchaeota archaeon]|nr:MAG: hypothetical protein EU537_11470 [Candidatus Thorarchaeota archaeon]
MELRKLMLPFIAAALGIVVLGLSLWVADQVTLLSIIMSTITLLSAFGVAIMGLAQFGEDGLVREDPFHMMNILLAFGLFAFTAGEGAALIISQLSDGTSFYFSTGILQMVGVALWLTGVFSYLAAVNEVMQFLEKRKLGLSIFVLSFLVIAIPLGASLIMSGIVLSLDLLTHIPLAIGLTMIVVSLGLVFTSYRDGNLAVPIGLALFGCLLFLIRVAFWIFFSFPHLNALNLIVASESYILLGASIIAARQVEFSV